MTLPNEIIDSILWYTKDLKLNIKLNRYYNVTRFYKCNHRNLLNDIVKYKNKHLIEYFKSDILVNWQLVYRQIIRTGNIDLLIKIPSDYHSFFWVVNDDCKIICKRGYLKTYKYLIDIQKNFMFNRFCLHDYIKHYNIAKKYKRKNITKFLENKFGNMLENK